jgi:hypothetical protein
MRLVSCTPSDPLHVLHERVAIRPADQSYTKSKCGVSAQPSVNATNRVSANADAMAHAYPTDLTWQFAEPAMAVRGFVRGDARNLPTALATP